MMGLLFTHPDRPVCGSWKFEVLLKLTFSIWDTEVMSTFRLRDRVGQSMPHHYRVPRDEKPGSHHGDV